MPESPRVVLDANVLLSAAGYHGTPGRVVDLWALEDRYQLIISPEIAGEFERALVRVLSVPAPLARRVVADLAAGAERVIPTARTRICRDPRDNMVLDTALTGHADFLVTGDQDLLVLKRFAGATILTPAQFLARLRG